APPDKSQVKKISSAAALGCVEKNGGGKERGDNIIERNVLNLAAKFLARPHYDRKLFQLLLQTAKGHAGESWAVRCFALVLMERQLSTLDPHDLPEFDHILVNLALKKPGENSVAGELVSSRTRMSLADFVPQLLRKINRRS